VPRLFDAALVTLVLLAQSARGSASAQAQPGGVPARPASATPSTSKGALPIEKRLDYVPAERFDHIRDIVVRTNREGATLFNAPDEQTSYMLLRRTKPSQVELHSRWDDLIVVRSGRGSVEVGPRVTRARQAGTGELRGGSIEGPTRLSLKPGDVTRIPAGVPHAFIPEGTEPWEMLVIKVRRPEKPLKKVPPLRSVSTPAREGKK
jgi:mannose-6-phosphate isomerase-like protein (cupin superfamily)